MRALVVRLDGFGGALLAGLLRTADGVPLGGNSSRCAGTRTHHCPAPGHPCLNEVAAHYVVQAVPKLRTEGA